MSKRTMIIWLTILIFLAGTFSNHAISAPVSALWKSILEVFSPGTTGAPDIPVIIIDSIKRQETSLHNLSLSLRDIISDARNFESAEAYVDSKINDVISRARMEIREKINNDPQFDELDAVIEHQLDEFRYSEEAHDFRQKVSIIMTDQEYRTHPEEFVNIFKISKSDSILNSDICVGQGGLSFSVGVGRANIKISTSGAVVYTANHRSISLPADNPLEYVQKHNITHHEWQNMRRHIKNLERKIKFEPMDPIELFLFYAVLEWMNDMQERTSEEEKNVTATSEICIGTDGIPSFSVGYDGWSTKVTAAGEVSFTKEAR